MKRIITQFRKIGLLITIALFAHVAGKAATFTAVASGNFSDAATWGGTAPSAAILLDNIVIPSGVNVTMDQTITINGALAIVDVDGSLTSSSNTALILTSGVLSGSGTIDVDSLVLKSSAGLTFSGNIIADDISSLASGIGTSADIKVSSQLWLASGSLDFLTNGSLELSPNATIIISGGVITASGGSLDLSNNYNVIYNTASTTAGLELSGAGLQTIAIDMPASSSSVDLTTDLTINGALFLYEGRLVLNGYDLTIGATGTVSVNGTGYVISTSSSDITINSTGGTTGTLRFYGSSVNNLTVAVGAGAHANIGGSLIVDGKLNLNSGILDFTEGALVLNDTVLGSGSLYGNSNSDLFVNASGGLGTTLTFAAGGQHVKSLDINIGTGGAITLGSDLTVHGRFNLSGGNQLNISNVQLMLNGDTITGTGTFTTNSGSGIHINTANSLLLNITDAKDTLGNLTFNGTTASTTLTLTGDLTVLTLFNLQGGKLILNGNDLTINGNITSGGTGTISATSASSVAVQTSTALSGGLTFTSFANTVDDFMVNVGAGNVLQLNSDLHVDGDLALQGGKIDIGNNDLAVSVGASVIGGSADDYVITSGTGNLQIALTANDSAIFHIGTSTDYTPAAIALNNGSASGVVGVRIGENVYSQGTAGVDISTSQTLVDATWHVESDITSNLNLDLKVMWGAALEVNSFNRSTAHLSHYINGNWDTSADIAATAEVNSMFSLRRDGLTSLSPFAVFGQVTPNGVKNVAAAEFNMFPNPTAERLVINCTNALEENMMVDIMNATGSVIKRYNITSDSYNVPVAEFATGTYFARVYNDKVSTVKSFSKL
jgi:hypothetical protein